MNRVTVRLSTHPDMRGLAVVGRRGDQVLILCDPNLRARERASMITELLSDDEFDAFAALYQQVAARTPGVPLQFPAVA